MQLCLAFAQALCFHIQQTARQKTRAQTISLMVLVCHNGREMSVSCLNFLSWVNNPSINEFSGDYLIATVA